MCCPASARSSTPECPGKEHENGKDLKSAGHHQEGEDVELQCCKALVVSYRADSAESGAEIRNAGNRRRPGFKRSQAGSEQCKSPRKDGKTPEQRVSENGKDNVIRDGGIADGYGGDGIRVEE